MSDLYIRYAAKPIREIPGSALYWLIGDLISGLEIPTNIPNCPFDYMDYFLDMVKGNLDLTLPALGEILKREREFHRTFYNPPETLEGIQQWIVYGDLPSTLISGNTIVFRSNS